MQLIDLIWLFVEHFYQTDQQQQEMGGLEIQLKTALPTFIFGVMLLMMMMIPYIALVFRLSRKLLTHL